MSFDDFRKVSYEGDCELNFPLANNSRVYCEYYCRSFCGGRFLVMIVEDYLELSGHRISIFCDPCVISFYLS